MLLNVRVIDKYGAPLSVSIQAHSVDSALAGQALLLVPVVDEEQPLDLHARVQTTNTVLDNEDVHERRPVAYSELTSLPFSSFAKTEAAERR